MSTPKGGRGRKADYRTVQIRCPEPLKHTVHEIIRRYHAQEFTPPTKQPESNQLQDQIDQLTKQIERLKRELEIAESISGKNFQERNEMWEKYKDVYQQLQKKQPAARGEIMPKCDRCNSDGFYDDDLHWFFCKNQRCFYSWFNRDKREYREAIRDLEEARKETRLLDGE